jgi:hypothetical protein
VIIGEGEWRDFVDTGPYRRRKVDNEISYIWDRLIQKTGQNTLNGTIGGNSDVFRGKSAIHEMAKDALRKPITGIAGCCARAPSGQATAPLPKSVMNSRRFTQSTRRRGRSTAAAR